MFNLGLLPKDSDHTKGLSWWIVHVGGPDDLSRKGLKLCWASDYVKSRVLAIQAKKNINVLKEISCGRLKNPPEGEKPSGYYERWCVHSLAAGAEMKPMIGDTPAEAVKLPVSEIIEMSYVPKLHELRKHSGIVHYCAGVNTSSYDAAVYCARKDGTPQLLLLQVTTAKTHGDYGKSPVILVEAKKESKKTGLQIRFIFIVPHKKKFILSKSLKKRQNEEVKIEVCEWNPCV